MIEPVAYSHGTVAHVSAPASFGGLERVVSGLTGALAPHRRVILITVLEPATALPSWAAELSDRGVIVIPLHAAARDYLAERRMLREVLQRQRVDIVHTHGYRSDVIAGGLARSVGLPTVSTVHGFTRHGLKNMAYEWLQVQALKRHSAVVAVSNPLAVELRRRGVPADRLSVIPNGLVPPRTAALDRHEARQLLGLAPDVPVIGWVGRFSKEKAPDVMIQACTMLADRTAHVCFIGDGPLLAASRAQAKNSGIADRVRFVGAMPDAAIAYHAFDVFALSSRTEGTPMVLLEAAKAALPVVATSVGGVPDLLGADHPGLVASSNPRALARALDVLLADSVAAAASGRRLHDRLSAPSVVDWIDGYHELYETLLHHSDGEAPALHQKSSVR